MRPMALILHRPTDVDAFMAQASEFLAAREAEHNLFFGITSQIRSAPELFAVDRPTFAVVVDRGGNVVAASMRTPPNNQVLSQIDDHQAVDLLADALAGEQLPGVLGPKEAAERFATRWADRARTTARLDVAERIFRLERVVPPACPAGGRWRLAGISDRDLIAGWITAFHEEATPGQPPVSDPEAVAERWVQGIYRRMYLWEDGGRVVCMVGAGGQTPNGMRIGPVYTPPDARGRGYASTLTAATSQDQLDGGHRFCFLFTDLANPTSNKIYRAIGYEPVCDVDMYRFGAQA